jgi:hypothetical protein
VISLTILNEGEKETRFIVQIVCLSIDTLRNYFFVLRFVTCIISRSLFHLLEKEICLNVTLIEVI